MQVNDEVWAICDSYAQIEAPYPATLVAIQDLVGSVCKIRRHSYKGRTRWSDTLRPSQIYTSEHLAIDAYIEAVKLQLDKAHKTYLEVARLHSHWSYFRCAPEVGLD